MKTPGTSQTIHLFQISLAAMLAISGGCVADDASGDLEEVQGTGGKADDASTGIPRAIPTCEMTVDESQFLSDLLVAADVPIEQSAEGPSRRTHAWYAWDLITPKGPSGDLVNPRPARGFLYWDSSPAGGIRDYEIEPGAQLYRVWELLGVSAAPFMQLLDADTAGLYLTNHIEGEIRCSVGGTPACTITPAQHAKRLSLSMSSFEILFDMMANVGAPTIGDHGRYARFTFTGDAGFADPKTAQIEMPDGSRKLADIDAYLLPTVWGTVDTMELDSAGAGYPNKTATVIVGCRGNLGVIECDFERIDD